MKINTITRTVKVKVSNREVFDIFIQAIYDDAKRAVGKELVLYRALGRLIGISDIDAVKLANHKVDRESRITVTEFRKWLPTVFAEFAKAMDEAERLAAEIERLQREKRERKGNGNG